ncbi:MAG: hypothetical protein IK066_07910, partial [Kiritimatiellae bacterium]|nr:hypothetical protein [Kiritimatiellia bacterium]
RGALCAGWAAAGVSHEFFLWMWHFGTVGAMTSATLVGPVAFLAWRLANGRGGWGTAALLGVAGWVACLWTPGAFAVAGIGAGWLLNWELWTKAKWGKFAAAAGLGAALWSPWLWTTLFPCRNVVEYVGTEGAGRPEWWTVARNGAWSLWRRVPASHPAVLALGIGGLVAGAPRGVRKLVLPAVAVLALMAGWSKELKPLSQMDRMWIPLMTLLCVPMAWIAEAVFNAEAQRRGGGEESGVGRQKSEGEGGRGRGWRFWAGCGAAGVLAAGLALGARTTWTFYRNMRPAKMRTYVPGRLEPLAEWIRENVPEDGRVAWAGKAVHAYGGGNTAYWPVLTGREMMGDDYYGFPEKTIEYDYPPRAYRALGEAGWRAFGGAYGVTHWIAARAHDVERLRGMPEFVEEVAHFRLTLGAQDVYVFAVKGAKGGRFWQGDGRVEARENLLRVETAGPAVIRYNWRKGLACRTPGAEIRPVEVDEHLTFIGVDPGTNGVVEIGYRPHWSGVEPNFDGRFHH